MREFHELLPLVILLGLGVLGPVLAARLRLPSSVVLMLTGMLVGPSALGWVHETPTISILARFGFLVLLFAAGMEIDFTGMRNAGRRALISPVLTVAFSFIIAVATGLWLGLSPMEILVVSATSVGMPSAMLQETEQARTPLGRQVLLTASLGEFVTILCIIAYEMGVQHGVGFELALELVKVLGAFTVSALLIRWARALVWWQPERFRRMVEHRDTAEMGVRVGLFLLLTFVAISVFLGLEAILGAFTAGALVSFVLREKETLEHKISALGHGLFIPIFFLNIGVRFPLGSLDAAAFQGALVIVALSALVKVVPQTLFGSRQLSFSERFAAAILLSSHLTSVVAMATIGETIGVLDARQVASILLAALGLSVVFPVTFKLLVGGSARAVSISNSKS